MRRRPIRPRSRRTISSQQGTAFQTFLAEHRFSEEQFAQTGLDWPALCDIAQHHSSMSEELQNTAEDVVRRLRSIGEVHSVKVRIKNPEHLLEKIVRKKIEKPDLEINRASYASSVTDLIGIRALHLFKDQWRPIHEFVTENWELAEQPIAYFRAGDPEALLADFQDAGCNVEPHKFGYRSIHYLLKSQPTKRLDLVELQVRTIFEEGWSEIDHQIRYPRHSDDPHLAQFLAIFNRLAGSADEMGTFTKALASHVVAQARTMAEQEREIKTKENALQKAISELKITADEKNRLKQQISELRSTPVGHPAYLQTKTTTLGDLMNDSSWMNYAAAAALNYMDSAICDSCKKTYSRIGPAIAGTQNLCHECQGRQFSSFTFTPPQLPES